MKRTFFYAITAIIFLGSISASASDGITKNEALKKVVQIFVVNVKTEKAISSGSGVIIDAQKRQVATALHVVNPAASNNSKFDLYVCTNEDVSERSSCYFAAKVVMYDTEHDVAIIEVDRAFDANGKKRPLSDYVQSGVDDALFADIILQKGSGGSDLEIGDDIWLAGYPASGGNTVTASSGILSGMESGEISHGNAITMLKTDASANHGNSGGPAFDSQNRLLGIVTSVRTDISPITFIVSWEVVNDLLQNGVMARQGVLCPDYMNMSRKHGDCVCNEGRTWNEATYSCETEEKQTEAEEEQYQPELPDTNSDLDPSISEEEEPQPTEEEAKEEPEPEQDSSTEPEQKADDFTGEEKEIGKKRMKDGILDTILECKDIKKYGREAYRICFKESFVDFIRARQKVLRKAKNLCREELGKDVSAQKLQTCVKGKFE